MKEVLHLKTVFDLFDRDHGASIDAKGTSRVICLELKDAIASLGIETKAEAVYKMIEELDSDGSGPI